MKRLVEPTVEAMGFALWGIDYRSYNNRANLCIFIDASEGVTVDDCAQVSQQIGGLLDVESNLPGDLTLEVSSPGVDRILFEPEQYKRYVGEEIEVRLLWPIEGRSHIRGRLNSCDESRFRIHSDEIEWTVDFEQVRRTRIVPSLNSR